MGSRVLSRYTGQGKEGTFHLQITSMVDMFTIILVFLLKGFSTSAIDLAPSSQVTLPSSTSTKTPTEVVKLIVSKDGVFVEDKKIIDFQNGALSAGDVDKTDPSFIRPLYEALDQQAQKTKGISKLNETVEFDGRVLMQADKGLSYGLLKKVMYTSMMAGYADVKLAVLAPE